MRSWPKVELENTSLLFMLWPEIGDEWGDQYDSWGVRWCRFQTFRTGGQSKRGLWSNTRNGKTISTKIGHLSRHTKPFESPGIIEKKVGTTPWNRWCKRCYGGSIIWTCFSENFGQSGWLKDQESQRQALLLDLPEDAGTVWENDMSIDSHSCRMIDLKLIICFVKAKSDIWVVTRISKFI